MHERGKSKCNIDTTEIENTRKHFLKKKTFIFIGLCCLQFVSIEFIRVIKGFGSRYGFSVMLVFCRWGKLFEVPSNGRDTFCDKCDCMEVKQL